MNEKKNKVTNRKHLLYIGLCFSVLIVSYEVGQAGFYVIPVVRDSASTTTCANDGYEVLSDTGQCWMAFNLGATQVATSIDDEAAYGDLYQWGRRGDGHERRDLDSATETTSTQSATDNPGHGFFITGNKWRSPRNDFLWQGISGINNPCPQGFRLPTEAEWQAEINQYGTTATALFNSSLKLIEASFRYYTNGTLYAWSEGAYWSSTVDGDNNNYAFYLYFRDNGAFMNSNYRTYGFSVRCIKD